MWHRPLLLLALIGFTPALSIAESLNGMASDYQVSLGLALSYQVGQSNAHVTLDPVFISLGVPDYEPALKRLNTDAAGLGHDPNVWRAVVLLAPLQMAEAGSAGLVPIGWAGPFGIWAPAGTSQATAQILERALVSLNGQRLGTAIGSPFIISTGGASDMLAKARAARAANPAPGAPPAGPPPPPAPPNPNLTDPPVSRQPPPPKHMDLGTDPSQKGMDSWLPPSPKVVPHTAPTETAAQRKSRLQALKNAEKQKADLEKQKSTERALKERRDLDALNKQQEDRKEKVKKSWKDRADYVDSQVHRADAITAGATWSKSAEIDGPNRWVYITLTNHTDIVMSVDLRYFGGKEGNQGDQWQPMTAVYPGNTDVILFATDGKTWVVRDVQLKWEANGFEYSVNVIPN